MRRRPTADRAERRGATSRVYRGADRRGLTRPARLLATPVRIASATLLAGLALVMLGLALGGLDRAPSGTSIVPTTSPVVVAALHAVAVAVAAVLAAACYLHGRATGVARSVRTFTAALALGGVAWVDLWTAAASNDGPGPLRFALLVGAAWSIGAALLGPDIDTRARATRDILTAAAVVLAVFGSSYLWLLSDGGTSATPHVAGVTIWVLVGAAGLWRRRRHTPLLHTVLASSCVGLAAGELALAAASGAVTPWSLVAAATAATVLLVLTLAWLHDLAVRVVSTREHLHDAKLRRLRVEDEDRSKDRARSHEVRNALLAVEGGTLALERYGDRLSPSEHQDLARAVVSGLDHLREVVETDGPEPEPVIPLRLARERAMLARAPDVDVTASGDADLRAVADESALVRILDNLLVNARRHGRSGGRCDVRITVTSEDDRAILRVHDNGPGIPAARREQVFEPGLRLVADREGDGLGLYIARDLARRQGGELLAEPSPDGGACLVLELPRSMERSPVQGVQEPEQGVDVLQPTWGRPADVDRSSAPSPRAVVEEHDDLGVDGPATRGQQRQIETSSPGLVVHDGDSHLGRQQRPQDVTEQGGRGRERDLQTDRT